jgi:magnesium transporter
VEEYKAHLFVVTYVVVPGGDSREVRTAEVDLFIGRNYVVSIHRGRVPALQEALARWTRGGQMLREGVGFLFYTVMDALIDSFFPVIDKIEDEVDETEMAMFAQFDQEGVRGLLRLKRNLVTLRRLLYPLREIFQVLLRRDHPLFQANTRLYFQDVYDHVLRMLDVVEIEREMVAGALEASLTVVSNRLNRTMKALAVITIGVAVVSSVFGAYGMNFDTIPLKGAEWGFWAVSGGTIALIALAMLVTWWRGWL